MRKYRSVVACLSVSCLAFGSLFVTHGMSSARVHESDGLALNDQCRLDDSADRGALDDQGMLFVSCGGFME